MPYIDRDELRKWIEGEIKSPSCPVGERPFGKRILMKIATTPTVEVVERKRGKWIRNNDSNHGWKCSFCGCGYTDYKLSYCYDCGAYMRGESDNEIPK